MAGAKPGEGEIGSATCRIAHPFAFGRADTRAADQHDVLLELVAIPCQRAGRASLSSACSSHC